MATSSHQWKASNLSTTSGTTSHFVTEAISLLASRKTRVCDLVDEKRWLFRLAAKIFFHKMPTLFQESTCFSDRLVASAARLSAFDSSCKTMARRYIKNREDCSNFHSLRG